MTFNGHELSIMAIGLRIAVGRYKKRERQYRKLKDSDLAAIARTMAEQTQPILTKIETELDARCRELGLSHEH
jgi:hypothetical protein